MIESYPSDPHYLSAYDKIDAYHIWECKYKTFIFIEICKHIDKMCWEHFISGEIEKKNKEEINK